MGDNQIIDRSIDPHAEKGVAIDDVLKGWMLTLFAVSVKKVKKVTKIAGVSTEEKSQK